VVFLRIRVGHGESHWICLLALLVKKVGNAHKPEK
jgi:hypothetical protein